MERRRANRYALRMKANVHSFGARALPMPIETWTRDVSARGMLLEMEEPPTAGTRLSIALQLPAEVVGAPVVLNCIARVVRVVTSSDGKLSVGAVIENYEFAQQHQA